jgi:radical SAM superfamily enzyme YgiQ (UPF0313 family)
MPTNSLAVLNGLAVDARDRKVLGEEVEIRITAIDETNTRVRIPRIIKMIQGDGDRALIGLVGVQSNQYPCALDIAREFRQAEVPVCIGGFHVSGVLAMLPELTPELKEAQAMGISLFAGEAEGRFDDFLRDAWRGELQPPYNYLDDLPDLSNAPSPLLPPQVAARTFGRMGSFDAGWGCPFVCSFCTIINVQGRKSRYRSADDVERLVRDNCAKGLHRFFITDDDFARNRNWEAILDRIIALREEGLEINLTL